MTKLLHGFTIFINNKGSGNYLMLEETIDVAVEIVFLFSMKKMLFVELNL